MIYIHSARNTSHHNLARLVPAPPQPSQLSHSLLSPQLSPVVSTGEPLGTLHAHALGLNVSVNVCVPMIGTQHRAPTPQTIAENGHKHIL